MLRNKWVSDDPDDKIEVIPHEDGKDAVNQVTMSRRSRGRRTDLQDYQPYLQGLKLL